MAKDLVYTSFEIVAEKADDISLAVYKNYFARCPGSKELMTHVDDIVRGRMLDEVYRLMMNEDYSDEESYLNFEVKNHRLAYSVKPDMYGNLLEALKEVIAESLGAEWNDAYELAWQSRIDLFIKEIQNRH
ncbi:globin [Pseudomonadales bacterium]|jgi:hemoglobin-like flavoprotein|nr:globin [Gammaproteobacteria bacterium]MDC1478852.1 globin [Pseudomonadales bacterium]